MNAANPRKQAAVLGGGVIGLVSGLRLLERGWTVTLYARELSPRTTSDVAAAFWLPYKVADDARVRGWANRTRATYGELMARGVPGVSVSPLVVLDDGGSAAGWPGARPADAAELPPGFARGTRLDVPRVETPVHLPWLLGEFARRGGQVVTRDVARVEELLAEHPLVVNCPGIGAARLVPDAAVRPIRGQVVRVQRPPGLDPTILIHEGPTATTYIVPREEDCILGGTAQAGDWDVAPDPATAEAIRRRCAALRPALAAAPVVGHGVGLRPGRPAVRLEREDLPGGRALIHHYGHGGAGFTLAWACADEVADLADAWAAGGPAAPAPHQS
ncbi:MAG: FAD-binding oxidoreductase [Opitutaceae bacterium]|nr:FAD-binding oxidoreductase [Opitutaceae bacterium]